MRSRVRARRFLVFGGVLTGLALAAVAAANTITTVRATSAYETAPAHNGNVLLWAQSSSRTATTRNVMAKIDGGSAFRVNTAGTNANTGDVNPASNGDPVAVYQQGGNLRFQDLITHAILPAPFGINTGETEFHPSMAGLTTNGNATSITGGWLLFGRNSSSTQKIILFNMSNGTSKVLSSGGATRNPGQVNGPDAQGMFYADWRACGITCDIHAYRFDPTAFTSGTFKSLGISQDHTAVGPGVSTDGQVTYIQGGTTCGVSVELNKIAFASMGSGAGTTLVDFPNGVDASSTYVDGGGSTGQVYFSKAACGRDSNLYRTSLALQP